MYSISSSKCKYDAGGIEMQHIWSLLQNTVLINNSCQLGVVQFPSFQRQNFVINEKQQKM